MSSIEESGIALDQMTSAAYVRHIRERVWELDSLTAKPSQGRVDVKRYHDLCLSIKSISNLLESLELKLIGQQVEITIKDGKIEWITHPFDIAVIKKNFGENNNE